MRIISGKFKKKKLHLPDSKITRPLRDYVKESLFNLISHSKLIKFNFEKTTIIDVFSGSGSFGLECLSRGSSKIIFFEKDKKTMDILKKNIHSLKANNQCEVFNKDIFKINFETFKENRIDLIFLDPPFQFKFFDELFAVLKKKFKYQKETLLILHYENKNSFDFHKFMDVVITKEYGRSIIILGRFKN